MESHYPPNRLAGEASPYLLQHAHNPVDWFPWGEEAFAKAKAEDKPIFLSIGYSTCHWCHVMAHESFEDPEVAALLNRHFVPVKVDKEERPDIDSVYMNVCVSLTGSGGWPTTLLMAPDGKPFFAGTYFPKRKRYGMPGLMELLESIRDQWETDRSGLRAYAGRVAAHVNKAERRVAPACRESKDLATQAIDSFKASFDPRFGGFGPPPKFPMPHCLLFLLRAYSLTHDEKCLRMAETTLMGMAKGGIFDHIGYGFSRYSTDEQWLVPHFEKMLYDNALLIMAYASAYQITGNQAYRSVAEKIIAYIARDMTHPNGGFFSAQDADSDGVEGKFYVFTPEEAPAVLGEEKGARFNRLYGITEKGNFEGGSIPNQIALPGLDDSLAADLPALHSYRKSRAALHLDDKTLTAWNALMIAALCEAAMAFASDEALAMATHAADFIDRNLFQGPVPFVSFRAGKRSTPGMVDDYAFLIYARLKLYQATLEAPYLEGAQALCRQTIERFWDAHRGGFYLYGKDAEPLISRPKETHDGALPSGNSAMALNLALLFQLTGLSDFEALMEKQFAFMREEAAQSPGNHAFFLLALLQKDAPGRKITVAFPSPKELPSIRQALRGQGLVSLLPHGTEAYPLVEGKTTYYVCDGFACRPPTTSLDEALS